MHTRRGFLRQIVFGAQPVVENPGVHTLVVVFLRGGADTLNMVVPHGDGDYYRNRPTLSIAAPGKGTDAAVKLDDFYAFHPKMAPLVPLYTEGRLGIVQAVGTDNPTGSHFEAQDQIEHGESYGHSLGGGWLGRHLRARAGSEGGDSPLAGVSIGATLTESLAAPPPPAPSARSTTSSSRRPRATRRRSPRRSRSSTARKSACSAGRARRRSTCSAGSSSSAESPTGPSPGSNTRRRTSAPACARSPG